MRTLFTVHATITCPDTPGITFNVIRRTEEGALVQCRIALMQLGYAPSDYTLELQNSQRLPQVFDPALAA